MDRALLTLTRDSYISEHTLMQQILPNGSRPTLAAVKMKTAPFQRFCRKDNPDPEIVLRALARRMHSSGDTRVSQSQSKEPRSSMKRGSGFDERIATLLRRQAPALCYKNQPSSTQHLHKAHEIETGFRSRKDKSSRYASGTLIAQINRVRFSNQSHNRRNKNGNN